MLRNSKQQRTAEIHRLRKMNRILKNFVLEVLNQAVPISQEQLDSLRARAKEMTDEASQPTTTP